MYLSLHRPVINTKFLCFDFCCCRNSKKRGQAVALIVTETKIKTRKMAFGFQSPADATKETCFFDTIFG